MTPQASGILGISRAALPLIGMGSVAAILFILVFSTNAWVARLTVPDPSADSLEASKTYRRYVVAAVLANGSARDWDHGVRPLLGELIEVAISGDCPHSDLTVAARRLLGEELWSLADGGARFSEDEITGGPGREVLDRILDRLEDPGLIAASCSCSRV